MKNTIEHLQKVVIDYSEKLNQVSEEDFSKPVAAGKWNKKEELGHLIDSAHNNLRRFIVGQYMDKPNIVYDQNFWVQANNYKLQPSAKLIALWKSVNLQLNEVLKKMPEENFTRECDTGKEKPELHSLEWLAKDYLKHMKHHLHHILSLEPIPY